MKFDTKKPFGEQVRQARKEKNWTINDFIRQLGYISFMDAMLSPAYISKVEVYGEIPTPGIICKMVDLFGWDVNDVLNTARRERVELSNKVLEESYSRALKRHLEHTSEQKL